MRYHRNEPTNSPMMYLRNEHTKEKPKLFLITVETEHELKDTVEFCNSSSLILTRHGERDQGHRRPRRRTRPPAVRKN